MSWLLLVDLDGTLWDHHDISLLNPPFRKINKYTIMDRDGYLVRLNTDMVNFVKWAKNMGAITSTLSWNIYKPAYEAIKTFQLEDLFDYITIEPTHRKDQMLKRLLRLIKRDMGERIPPENIVYIDDRDIHIDDIYNNIGKIYFINYKWEIYNLDDLIHMVSKYLSTHRII